MKLERKISCDQAVELFEQFLELAVSKKVEGDTRALLVQTARELALGEPVILLNSQAEKLFEVFIAGFVFYDDGKWDFKYRDLLGAGQCLN